MKQYRIRFAPQPPDIAGSWDNPAWRGAETARLDQIRPESSDHRPLTEVKLLYDNLGIYGLFRVDDRFVRCVHAAYGDPVFRDSCVEFFVKPCSGRGYFNFEFNCGGAMLAYYITDHRRQNGGFRAFVPLEESDARRIRRHHSLPDIVEPEISMSVTWFLGFMVPFEVLSRYCGTVAPVSGHVWQCNFFKCGDETSHPHWISWSAVAALNFHCPECFGNLLFG